MASSDFGPAPQQTRRSWLDLVLRVFGGVTAMSVLTPALSYLWPITRRGPGGGRKEIAGAEKMTDWESKAEVVNGKPVIIVKKPNGFAAYSAVCTHLGCIVRWDAKKHTFDCPCHAASFDEDGKVLSGPPPKPIGSYAVTLVGDKLYVEG